MIAHAKNKVSTWRIAFVLSRTALLVFMVVIALKKLNAYAGLNDFDVPVAVYNFSVVALILLASKIGVGDLIKRLAKEAKKDTVDNWEM